MTTTSEHPERPGRPLGLTLAIILSAFLYAILPLFQMGVTLFIQDRISRVDSPIVVDGQTLNALASGGDVLIQPAEVIVNGTGALLFLIVAILAWRGGRWWYQPLFTGMVLAYAGITAYVTLRTLLAPADLAQGVTSADTIIDQVLCGRLTATILVPLYVIWYINRAPARAFYRGSYIDQPETPES